MKSTIPKIDEQAAKALRVFRRPWSARLPWPKRTAAAGSARW
jgi:hypothetical protein